MLFHTDCSCRLAALFAQIDYFAQSISMWANVYHIKLYKHEYCEEDWCNV